MLDAEAAAKVENDTKAVQSEVKENKDLGKEEIKEEAEASDESSEWETFPEVEAVPEGEQVGGQDIAPKENEAAPEADHELVDNCPEASAVGVCNSEMVNEEEEEENSATEL